MLDASVRPAVASFRIVCLGALLTFAAALAYANSFAGAYVLDDDRHITQNERIHSIGGTLRAIVRGQVRRPLVELSLAINKHFAPTIDGQPGTWGFHLFNLIVHTLAGLTLFGLIRRTLHFLPWRDRFGPAGPWIALAIALLWIVHPLQTQSVTYIIQRGESMMGLFYLLTAYCVVRAAEKQDLTGLATIRTATDWERLTAGPPIRTAAVTERTSVAPPPSHAMGINNEGQETSLAAFSWMTLAVLACALGMGCKAVMVTAPLVVYFYDALLLSRSYTEPFRRRWGLYLALCATWSILFYCGVVQGVLSFDRGGATVGFSVRAISPKEYFFTQLEVIPYYLRLSFWPVPLCLDYAWPAAERFLDAFPQAAVTIMLALATLGGLLRRSGPAIFGVWFFGILFPTSSFIPMKDAMFEHRMYLPLAAVIAIVVLSVAQWLASLRRAGHWESPSIALSSFVLVAAVTVPLTYATIDRNRDYHSDLGMWQDVIAKSPHNARAYLGYGESFYFRKRYAEAEGAFTLATRRNPRYVDAWYNLGNARYEQNKFEEAIEAYLACLSIHERYQKAYYNLGNAYKGLERYDDAVAAYRKAIDCDPRHRSAYINLGNTLKLMGRLDEAIEQYHAALAISPSHANAHFNLGHALFLKGDAEAALRELDLALQYNPDHNTARQVRDVVVKALEEGK